MRGIRGATTVEANTRDDIWHGAQELLQSIMNENSLTSEDIDAIIFSMTEDLTAAFPTAGLRQMTGFETVPLFDARQPAVDDSLPGCIRVLVFADTNRSKRDIHHVYLRGAKNLRPDLARSNASNE